MIEPTDAPDDTITVTFTVANGNSGRAWAICRRDYPRERWNAMTPEQRHRDAVAAFDVTGVLVYGWDED